MPHFGHFDLDVPIAIRDQLVGAFGALTPIPLSEWDTLAPPPKIGVYGLHHEGKVAYVGKAKSLRKRLRDHWSKIVGRQNISRESVGAVFLTVNKNWSAYAPEDLLRNHYNALGECDWDRSSFGNHDPGRTRELTSKPPQSFDQRFPIRLDWPCTSINAGPVPILEALLAIKKELPYLLRYETSDDRTWRTGHPDFDEGTVTFPTNAPTAADALRLIAQSLPGWQATAFPSHVILYKEERDYPHGETL